VNTLNITTEIVAKESMPARELTFHVVVLERRITGITGLNGETSFKNVVKIMLPDAAGTTLYKAWTNREKRTSLDTWNMEHVYDPSELRVVVFIQDESTHEIYQAEWDSVRIPTGIYDNRPGSGSEDRFIVFPNPASKRVFIRFDKPVDADVHIKLYNNLGSLVYTDCISKGEGEIEISAGEFPDGLYLVRAIKGDQVTGIRKLCIIR
jgi:hypothetical protein